MLRVVLAKEYEVLTADNGKLGLRLATEYIPDLIILDLILPDMPGLGVCKKLRAWYTGPILVISVQNSDDDKVVALDHGADDFLVKPFSVKELQARINALLRRVGYQEHAQAPVAVSGLEINLTQSQIRLAGREVPVTQTELCILACLVRQAGNVVPQQTLLEQVWGKDRNGDFPTLRVHINRLRKKLEPQPDTPRYLVTIPGVGYRLNLDSPDKQS